MAQVLTDIKGERFVDTKFSGGKNRLCVDAELEVSDIQIGAVEIKDGNSDLRADVEISALGKNGLVVIPTEIAKQSINNFGNAVLAPDASLTLASYTVPVGKRFIFKGGVVGGSGPGAFSFRIASSTQCLVRNSGSNRTIQLNFP